MIMNKKDISNIFSSEDQNLLDVINTSYLTLEDVAWLKKKRWFKKFLKIYSKELKKRYEGKPLVKKDIKPKEEDVEILDFTKTISIPKKEVIEILDFTKTIDITDVKDIADATSIAKRKVKREKMIWSFIIAISSFVLIILIAVLINWLLENKKTDDVLETIYMVSDVKEIKTTTKSSDNVITTTSIYDEYENMNMLEVNFDNLKKINSDTVGWIKVNGTKINYPFVHTSDNEYYLKHTFDKTSNKKGWVFLDFRNDIENLSSNNILYAHGLANNQMFGSLRKTIKSSWYNNKSNHIITIATPSGTKHFEIFSSYTILPESYYITTGFKSDNEFETFINTIKERSVYDYNVDVNTSDKILTLSSCYDNEKRMVLHAKLIK